MDEVGDEDEDSRYTTSRGTKNRARGSRPPKAPEPLSSPGKKTPSRHSSRESTGSSSREGGTGGGGPDDKLSKILQLGNQWKTMKEQHEMASQQATTRRGDLTKEIL
jgi:hypothetical protein